MAIIKDDREALKRYYPLANIVIIISFLFANAFVVMQLIGSEFLTSWVFQLETSNGITARFSKAYPGIYFVFQNFCYPAFWLINDMPHEVSSWLATFLDNFSRDFPDVARDFGIKAIHKFVAEFSRSSSNFVLHFIDSKLYVYTIGEVVISVSAIVYGLLLRFVTKILYHIIG